MEFSLWILRLFLFLITQCQPSANEGDGRNFADNKVENEEVHHGANIYPSSITSGSIYSEVKEYNPSEDHPSRHVKNSGHNSVSHVMPDGQQSIVHTVESSSFNHGPYDTNKQRDHSGSRPDEPVHVHKSPIYNAEQILPVPSALHPGIAHGQKSGPSDQSRYYIYENNEPDNRSPQRQVPGVGINQPLPHHSYNERNSMESNHYSRDVDDGPIRKPSDDLVARSRWEAVDQHSYNDRLKKPRRDIPPEYQLDEVFSLPSREDPIQNHVDFVSLVVIVPPGVKHCYFYKPIADFEVEYQVVKGGHLDVGIFIRDPEGEPVAIRPPLSDSQVSVSVPKHFRLMPYAICLDNRKASYAYKNVYFSVDVNLNWDNPNELERQAIETLRNNALANSQAQEANAAHVENIEKLMAQLDMIFGRLRRIEHMQQRSSNFDSADKSLMEENLERITTGSLFQVILMIAVATVQVGLIRSLFDQQSYFYKIWLGNRSHNIHARC
ncbi:Transmembrane emp24 domain-containing protein isoform 1 [Schistosoma japonicum]|uniref:Transmembrane emp24 domain-containing protein isoform 1 n=2 Tax=Schistosoma japonicum TaxID=6182 RepID=A0A4Z2DV04_SCHJA|nr:Transmembrane emp24 domain-containing protein [Schistosoma japonicum]TNN20287.1 Transmembrane emp24 domain-containing protein isoform 1 [Schistosoma japonicum]